MASASAVGEPIQERAAMVVEWMHEAQQAARKASTDALIVKEAVTKANTNMASVLSNVGAAKAAMDQTQADERKISMVRDEIWRKAKKAALAEIPKILPVLREEAERKATLEAKKKAGDFKKDMLVKARVEGAKASKLYTDQMNRVGQSAADYARLGDSLVSESSNMQMDAGTAQSQAGDYIRTGQVGEAQKLLQKSRGEMNMALGLNEQATGMYERSNKITDELPAYAGQAAMAAFHAQSMYDPDARPPPPPLVLAQKQPLLSQAKRVARQ